MVSKKMLSFGAKDNVYFEVIGDSMDDGKRHSLLPGDTIMVSELAKRIWMKSLKSKGNVYVLVANTGEIFVKEVLDFNEETKEITCHSWNPSPEYKDFKMTVSNIEKIYCIDVVSRNLEKYPQFRASA